MKEVIIKQLELLTTEHRLNLLKSLPGKISFGDIQFRLEADATPEANDILNSLSIPNVRLHSNFQTSRLEIAPYLQPGERSEPISPAALAPFFEQTTPFSANIRNWHLVLKLPQLPIQKAEFKYNCILDRVRTGVYLLLLQPDAKLLKFPHPEFTKFVNQQR